VREADVLVESFRPGVMERLGVGYAALAQINPKLVYCAITGYGSDGPFAQRAGHDLNYLGYAGVLDQLRAGDGTPVIPNLQIADLLGGASSAVTRILAALWQVARGGNGAFVDVSMTHAVHAHNIVAQVALANGDPAGDSADNRTPQAGSGLLDGGVPCYNVYRTADGRWLAVAALELKFWETLCNALERTDWASRHWSLGQAIGGADAAQLTQDVANLIAERPLDEWLALFEPLDCCVSPVLSAAEAARHILFRGGE
jgi:crotonobetainyl-CoA:carnitine CoA-transferase CaiB-like acyl-CoA transferase